MKKQIFLRLLGIAFIHFFISNSFAQQPSNNFHLASVNSYSDANKVFPDHFSTVSAVADGITVSPKAQRAFDELFQNSESVNWSAAGKNYLITFSLDNKKNRVLLDKNGFLIYSICYGTEKDMPADIRKLVKSVYYDYSIDMTTQVKLNKRMIWLILLEDSNKFLTVRIENDEMEEVKQLNKIK